MRVLFVLKRREDYDAKVHSAIGLSTGLYNSASFMDEMLQKNQIESKLVVVVDNNGIDREVALYKPTHVIVEALWVVPTKFAELQKLHPTVQWIVRLHSEMPFMAGEGIAMDWVGDYSSFKNVKVACNAPRMLHETRLYLQHRNGWDRKTTEEHVIYLPNYYPQTYQEKPFNKDKDYIDIGCFGAIRPLKNHLVQAFAAIEFANKIDKQLRFHVNAGRIEMQGSPVLHNLKGVFQQIAQIGKNHQMVNHTWAPRDEFLQTCKSMDIGLQVSFSETFNIVGADLISMGVPLVGSAEIPWSSFPFNAKPTECHHIAKKLELAYNHPKTNVFLNGHALTRYTNKTESIWNNYFKGTK